MKHYTAQIQRNRHMRSRETMRRACRRSDLIRLTSSETTSRPNAHGAMREDSNTESLTVQLNRAHPKKPK